MSGVHTVVICLAITANGYASFADFTKAGFVLKTSEEVGVARSWLPTLGFLKGAGALGLLLGLFGIPIIGIAAAAGLVAFFIGAVTAHVRARVFYNIAFPTLFLALAAVSLVFFVLH